MAVTVSLYNQAAKVLTDSTLALGSFKVALLNGYSFDATDVAWADVSASDAGNANGWAATGEALANVAVTTVSTNDAKFDADDMSKTASGGSIGPATGAVIYESVANKLVAYIDFGGSQEAGVGTDFKINWHANGIFTFTVT